MWQNIPFQTKGINLRALLIQPYLNLAFVQIKSTQYADAIKPSSSVLELEEHLSDSDKARALYRRGMAYGQSREEDLAVEDLEKALEWCPNDVGIANGLNAMRARQKLKREKERTAYGKMFS